MKILLNCLPPAEINNPSISLSILKKFMSTHGFETDIKYWNFSLSLMTDYIVSEDTETKLLPFLSILNDQAHNTKGNNRIISKLQQLQPSFKAGNPYYYSDFLNDTKESIYNIIRNELEDIDFSTISLFGISAKYNQWIPGVILAEEIKKIAPNVNIIVGGFGSEQVALEAMLICSHFDFVCWGEGEYPLLELSKQLESLTPDFKKVPRLIYREEKEIRHSTTNKSDYLCFDNYIYPDYSDYIDNYPDSAEIEHINIPINTIRSCHWSKCKFCDFNKGYKLRMRSPQCIVNEIEDITNEYDLVTFTFVDSDTFGNADHFEELLDLIIALKYRNEQDYIFWAEIIPNAMFTANLIEKMAIAGFKNIFIGYDAVSDSLLSKMNKSNSFSDNIFFVKHALKNGIAPIVNVIRHVPDETEDDVLECINNLHYLRFFYNDSITSFSHIYVNLVLSSMTKYYSVLSDEEIAKYDSDDLTYLMPDDFSNNENRYHLFRYEKSRQDNIKEWNKLKEVENYYKTNKFSYKIQQNKGVFYYTEYCNDTEIENIVFGESEYGCVLKAVKNKICSFDELYQYMTKKYPKITTEKVQQILINLKEAYLIYCNAAFSNIVSIIDAE